MKFLTTLRGLRERSSPLTIYYFFHPFIKYFLFSIASSTVEQLSQSTLPTQVWYLKSNGCCLGTESIFSLAFSISFNAISIHTSCNMSGNCPNKLCILASLFDS